MTDLIPVNILVADRTYRLKIEPGDEEMIRKTAAQINEKIAEFRTHLAGKDMQDYVAMVLLWFATEQRSKGMEWLQLENLSGSLSAIEKYLDKALLDQPETGV
ncbi:MAG TPA: cell division protein ZapA [Puia sp.]|nr:cell division protein ZapA [Puia sp.]